LEDPVPRTKTHFKVHASIRNHRKMAGVWSSNDLLALWVRLGVSGVESYTDRTGDVFLVPDSRLVELTGFGHQGKCRRTLIELEQNSPLTVIRNGLMWDITFPNFARKQGFSMRNSTGMDDFATTTATAEEKEVEPAARADISKLERHERRRTSECGHI
jgi:hypothetical protein